MAPDQSSSLLWSRRRQRNESRYVTAEQLHDGRPPVQLQYSRPVTTALEDTADDSGDVVGMDELTNSG